jgi:adenylate cyclase
MRLALHRRLPVAAGLVTLAALLAAAILLPKTMSEALRDSAFDLVLAVDQPLRRPVAPDLKVHDRQDRRRRLARSLQRTTRP